MKPPFNDLMGMFLNGETPADSIATVDGKVFQSTTFGLEVLITSSAIITTAKLLFVAGTTVPLVATGKTTKKTGNVIHIALADMDDVMYNSYIFFARASLTCMPGTPAAPTSSSVAAPVHIPPSVSPSRSQAPTSSPAPTSSSSATSVPTVSCLKKKEACKNIMIVAIGRVCAWKDFGQPKVQDWRRRSSIVDCRRKL
jgi:hypothetical protein